MSAAATTRSPASRPARRGMLAAVAVGGAAGALARAGVAAALPPGRDGVPWATLLVNIAGAALLGWVAAAVTGAGPRALLGPGFCGALTTFSTLQLELLDRLQDGRVGLAVLYAALSLGAGQAAIVAGGRLGRPPTAP